MSRRRGVWCAERTLRTPRNGRCARRTAAVGWALPTVRVLVLAIAAAGATLACGEPELPAADASYEVRGQVIDVPREACDNLTVHHEAIAEFRDRDGKPSEMESMSMPFLVAPGVSLAGIAPGDKVEMTFEVRWQGDVPLRVTALRELPEATALDLGGPQLELVVPFGTPRPAATPAATTPPSDRPATDGPSAPPGETI